MTAAPNWYPDPTDARIQRWWDGTQWTEHTRAATAAQSGAAAESAAAQTAVAQTAAIRGADSGAAQPAWGALPPEVTEDQGGQAAEPRRRRRAWVLPIATGVTCLLVGMGFGAAAAGADPDPTQSTEYQAVAATLASTEAERDGLEEDLDEANDELTTAEDRITELEAAATTAGDLAARETQVAEREAAVQTRETDVQTREDAVAAQEAAAAAAAAAPAAAAPAAAAPAAEAPAAAPASSTNPRFGTCKEAKANGYGSYVKGVDPEYDWYRDADGDGRVCE
ncbi:DUF2510 domain-containing protein [Miniimonas sp. S16]|nr:DUF2510 domain-containing protein [Miniimonas sp. S16]